MHRKKNIGKESIHKNTAKATAYADTEITKIAVTTHIECNDL